MTETDDPGLRDDTGREAWDLAREVAQRISEARLSYDGRSTWVGGVPQSHQGKLAAIRYETLGPTVYSGTAGVAIFLAAAARADDNPQLADVAREALGYALDRADDFPSQGLFTGVTGVWVAEVAVCRLLGIALPRTLPEPVAIAAAGLNAGFDLLSGQAGIILALLDANPERGGVRAAQLLGDSLLANSVTRRRGAAWQSQRASARRPLTGISHGAAGAALALAALGATTQERRFFLAAEKAVEYEDSTFDSVAGNWPDFRVASYRPRTVRPGGLAYWCHGAPGIALSRMLAHRLVPDTDVRHLRAALSTTRSALHTQIESGDPDVSLCHGVSGLVEVLLHVRGLAPHLCLPLDTVLISNYVSLLRRRFADEAGMHCGTHAGETPSGMLGLAGVGLTLLRIHDMDYPSLLDPTWLARK